MYSEMEKRKFSKDEKLQIIKEAGELGVTITLGKYGIYPATFYSWKKKFETMGEDGFRHGMTVEHLKEIKRLEKENSMLKKLLAEKELEGRLKDEMIKKVCTTAKKEIAIRYIGLGLKRDKVLRILQLSRHQYYYKPKAKRPGRVPTQTTKQKQGDIIMEVDNQIVVDQMKTIQSNPDIDYGYRKMYYALMIMGYLINHKKVYRLMFEHNMLKEFHKRSDKTYVAYRIVAPDGPLQVLEMDIKYVWITQGQKTCLYTHSY